MSLTHTRSGHANSPAGCPICDSPFIMFERRVGLFRFFRCSKCAFLWALAQLIGPLVEASR